MNCLKKDYLDRVKHIDLISIFIIFNRIKLSPKESKSFMLHTLKYKLQKDKLIKLLGSYPIYKGYNPFLFNFKKFI